MIENGKRFGRLVVIEYSHKTTRKYWICRCDCGNYNIVSENSLISGHVRSCGCLKRERMRKYNKSADRKGKNNGRYKHGLSGTRLYTIWASMKERCFNPKATEYSSYGGRGITVCKEWKEDAKKICGLGCHSWICKRSYT